MPAGQSDTSFWKSLQRTVPIVTPDDLDEETAYDLWAFLSAPSLEPDAIVLIESSGRCVWTSAELELSSGVDAAMGLGVALRRALAVKLDVASGLMDVE